MAIKRKRTAAREVIRLDGFLPYLFSLLTHRMSLSSEELRAGKHALTMQEWKVLAIIADHGPLTPLDIRRRGTQDKSTISWAIKRLRQRGLIATRPKARDGRTFDALMTEEGWKFYAALAPKARRRANEGLKALSAAELRTLRRLVGKLVRG